MRISGLGGGGECCKSTAGCPGVCTSHACPASCPGLPTLPRGPKPPYPPPAGLRLTGKQHRAGAGGFGMVGGGGWGGWRPLGPSPELGVVDQGAEGGGEGGRFALQPRRAGSGHGLPWGGRRRKAAQAGGRPAGLGRPQGGGRCAVRHGALLGKPGRQHRDQAARLSGRQREGERGGGGAVKRRSPPLLPRRLWLGVCQMGSEWGSRPAYRCRGSQRGPGTTGMGLAPQAVALLQRSLWMGQVGVKGGRRLGFWKRQHVHRLNEQRSPPPPHAQPPLRAAGHGWVPNTGSGANSSPVGRSAS